jgi:GNAT superfamily N-acetyltransferase
MESKMNHRSFLLELLAGTDFHPKKFPLPDIVMIQASGNDGGRCRRLWSEVGRGFWSERADWNLARWSGHLSLGNIWFGIAMQRGEDFGFFELARDGEVAKIEGFGLLPAWRGRGCGGGLLSAATQRAFELGARRIWLHTATDDHPNALPNYQKRGYRTYHEAPLKNPIKQDNAA